jgi:hypothetical protein
MLAGDILIDKENERKQKVVEFENQLKERDREIAGRWDEIGEVRKRVLQLKEEKKIREDRAEAEFQKSIKSGVVVSERSKTMLKNP